MRLGSVRYSVPREHVGSEVWVRVVGDEVVIVARTSGGLREVARHERSTPGNPRIEDAHYPDHPSGRAVRPRPRPVQPAERAFLAIGPGAEAWLVEAAASGAVRIRSKMARAVELAAIVGAARVDEALALAAAAGRFADGDLASICDHLAVHDADHVQDQPKVQDLHSANQIQDHNHCPVHRPLSANRPQTLWCLN